MNTNSPLNFFLICSFIYFWLCWVFTAAQPFPGCGEQSLFSSYGGQVSHCSSFSCCRAQALEPAGFSSCGCCALEHKLNSCGLGCSEVCGIFSDQALNLCFLHWQGYSLSLSQQGNPIIIHFWNYWKPNNPLLNLEYYTVFFSVDEYLKKNYLSN